MLAAPVRGPPDRPAHRARCWRPTCWRSTSSRSSRCCAAPSATARSCCDTRRLRRDRDARPRRSGCARSSQSLRAQTLATEHFEVDRGRRRLTDGTAGCSRLERSAAGWICALVRHDTAGGPARARNAGWRAARAPLIAFTDDDCVAVAGLARGRPRRVGRAEAVYVQGATAPIASERDRLGPFAYSIEITGATAGGRDVQHLLPARAARAARRLRRDLHRPAGRGHRPRLARARRAAPARSSPPMRGPSTRSSNSARTGCCGAPGAGRRRCCPTRATRQLRRERLVTGRLLELDALPAGARAAGAAVRAPALGLAARLVARPAGCSPTSSRRPSVKAAVLASPLLAAARRGRNHGGRARSTALSRAGLLTPA